MLKDKSQLPSLRGDLLYSSPGASLLSLSYLATLLSRKDDEDYFSSKLGVRIKDTNNSPHGKFHRFLFPFSSKFSDLNFASYVLYNLPVLSRVTHSEPGLPMINSCQVVFTHLAKEKCHGSVRYHV